MSSASPVSSAHDPCARPSRQLSLPFLQLFKSGVLRRSLCTSIAILLALACLPSVEAALRNATIDDQEGNELTKVPVQFLPTTGGVWEGEECGGCRVKPPPAFAFKNTYNAATYRRDAGVDPVEFGFQFTGSALYVFLTLAHNCGTGITTLTETNFTMDDGPPTFFRHTPNMSRTDFDYQYPAYVQENMEHRTHTFKATTSGPDYHIFINFDYAIYTYDDALFPNSVGSGSSTTSTVSSATTATSGTATSTSTSTSSTSSGSKNLIPPIVGGVVGGLAIFGLFIFALIYIRRRTRKASTPAYLETELQGGAGVVGASTSGMGRWRRRRDGAKEYPDPQIFASNDQLNETRYARSGYTTTQGLSSITPFTYNSIPTASTHSLGGPMQDSSISANGSGSSGTMYPPGPYAVDTGRGSRRGGGEATSPQHSRNHRVGGSGGAASDNTGLSYVTDLRARDMELPRYTPGLPSDSGHQHGYSHSNQDVLSVGSGSSMTGNPYGGIEESVYAATGVRLDPMPPRRTYHALNHQESSPTLATPPPPGAGGAAQPMSDLDTQMHALQDSIRLVIANLQIEREALSARGMSHEAIQRDAGLEKMTENLRRMAEEMSVLQQRRGEPPTESRRTTSTQPPSYASWGPRE